MADELLLASGSPRRRDLLRRLDVSFEVLEPTGVDESSVAGSAYERCQRLAVLKAQWGLKHGNKANVRVIGADTVVALGEGEADRGGRANGELEFGKPSGREDARRMLTELSGRRHRVMTGIAVVQRGVEPVSAVEISEVNFRDLNAEEIETYLQTGDAEGKAGAYGIQSHGRQLVAGFRGCYYNIVGLPLRRLAGMLGVPYDCDCEGYPLQQGCAGCGRATGERARGGRVQ